MDWGYGDCHFAQIVSRKQTLRIATRSSELALRQARMVAQRLSELGVQSELVTYKTTGDKNLDIPLSKIGAKGLFTQELEHDLLKGKVHCCVHSLKDLPTTNPEGLEIGAMLEREDPRDVLVVNHLVGSDTLQDLPRGSRVGTSSLRRRAQLLALRNDLEVVELRGNVPTRVRKVDDGQVHAAILAAAGLLRLEARQRIRRKTRALLQLQPHFLIPIDLVVNRGDKAQFLGPGCINRHIDICSCLFDPLGLPQETRLQPRQAVAHRQPTEVEAR